jgi:hypothetical protein
MRGATISTGEGQIRRLSDEGGDNFSFTPEGTELLYASGGRVWRQAISGGERVEIPVRLPMHSPTPPAVLIRAVHVLDFTTGGFGKETSIYLEGGRIGWIGTEGEHELPGDVVILDGGGRFAIPGLFDMHVHATAGGWGRSDFQEAWLAYGVTSVREASNDLAVLMTLADRSEVTRDPVPRYFFAGNEFCGELGPLPWENAPQAVSFVLSDESDVRFYVRRFSERGVHFIKTHPCLSWSLHRALADEARRAGLPVMEHGNLHEWLLRSVTVGSSFVEHFDCAVDAEQWGEARSAKLSVIGAAYRRGVRLYVGTDAPYGPVPGASLHRELRSFAHAGIPPLEVLRFATQKAAEAVGAGDDLGALEVGKLADIVLLDANPLEDITNTQTIWRVIKGGWVFDPEELRPSEYRGTGS